MAKRFIQNNFYSFASASLGISMVSGWMCLNYIQGKNENPNGNQPATVLGDTSSRPKSREEMRLQAMVENALKSSWQENLNNAFDAQERFMLPGRDHKDPKFLEKIDKRAEELLKKQERKRRREEKRRMRGGEGAGFENDDSYHQSETSFSETSEQSNKEKNQNKIQFWR